jgi:hypothetical protein
LFTWRIYISVAYYLHIIRPNSIRSHGCADLFVPARVTLELTRFATASVSESFEWVLSSLLMPYTK